MSLSNKIGHAYPTFVSSESGVSSIHFEKSSIFKKKFQFSRFYCSIYSPSNHLVRAISLTYYYLLLMNHCKTHNTIVICIVIRFMIIVRSGLKLIMTEII